MTPLHEWKPLNTRYEDEIDQIEPFKRYYLIFEDAIAGIKYFEGVILHKKELGIGNLIEIVTLRKVGEIRNNSHPENIYELINGKKEELIEKQKFDAERDLFVIVFDRDSFTNETSYIKYIEKCMGNFILAITSPCFELWLLLHQKDIVNSFIIPNYEKVLCNIPESDMHNYLSYQVSEMFHFNPKKRFLFSKFIDTIDIAIEQEHDIEQDIRNMFTTVGSNIGQLISEMRVDPRKSFLK